MSLTFNFGQRKSGDGDAAIAYHDTARMPHTLCFISASGARLLLHYSHLISMAFLPQSGKISLNFSSYLVTLEGNGLHDLFDALAAQKPKSIRETETRYAGLEGTGPLVTRITAHDKSVKPAPPPPESGASGASDT